MGLDAELCQKAKDLYGWDMKFEGDYRTHLQVEISKWVNASAHPAMSIAVENIKGRPTYGFADNDKHGILIYQPFATVYLGREQNFQEDLMRAALLHLRKDISEKQAEIVLPSSLRQFVRSDHLWLLQPENIEVKNFLSGITLIYREGTLDGITAVLNSLKIEDHQRE